MRTRGKAILAWLDGARREAPHEETELKTRIPTKLPCEFTERIVYLLVESGAMLPQFGAVAELEGRVDQDRMARALELLFVSEPVLGSRFVPDARRPHWRRLAKLDVGSLVQVLISNDPAADAAAFVASDFDPCCSAQMCVGIVRGATTDTLAVKVSHIALDGEALKQLLYLLGEIYRTLGAERRWLAVPNLAPRNPGAVARTASLRDKVGALRPEDVEQILPPTDWGIPSLGSRGWATYVSCTVGREEFQRAVEFGKAQGATIDDLLLTAYFRTLFRILVPPLDASTPIQMSCELRRHLPSDAVTALCNLSATWTAVIAPAGGERFEHTLARVLDQTLDDKNRGTGIKSALGLVLAGRLAGGQSLEATRKQQQKSAPKRAEAPGHGYPALTNIGVIEDESLDFGPDAHVHDAYLFGPIAYPAGFVLTATIFRDSLRLSAGVDVMAVDAELALSIVEGTAEEIARLGEAGW